MKDNIELLKELRELSGSSIQNCKYALDIADGDIELAKKILRAQGTGGRNIPLAIEARLLKIERHLNLSD